MIIRIPFTNRGFGIGSFQYSYGPMGKPVITENWWPISYLMLLLKLFFIQVPTTSTIVGRVADGPIHKNGCTQPIFLTLCNGDIQEDVKGTLTNPIWGTMLTIQGARAVAKRLNDEADYFEAFERK